jgi:thymidylate synthase (FAD)|tara:strand:- start:47 stop:718 length:672 start_codon:yes stop_codon:yes gene_type:complete
MFCEFVDKMGTDKTVVDAARVSFSKRTQWERNIPNQGIYELSDRDKKLINYLAEHNHWSPFGHCSISLHIGAPVFVARQLVKHTVGLCWNEVSRRYVDHPPEFYSPDTWRGRPVDKKQGSSDETVVWLSREERVGTAVQKAEQHSAELYEEMITAGVSPEQARMVLPQSMMTEWYWSGSLYAFARVCNLRCKDDTQEETREIAWKIDEIANKYFPVSWPALRD